MKKQLAINLLRVVSEQIRIILGSKNIWFREHSVSDTHSSRNYKHDDPNSEIIGITTPIPKMIENMTPTQEIIDIMTPTPRIIDMMTLTPRMIEMMTPTQEIIDIMTPTPRS